MKIICLSDTHGKHESLTVPAGDLLLHAGDFTLEGLPVEAERFFAWFAAQPHRHKVCIAGNHDFCAESYPEEFRKMIPEEVHYLNDSGVELEGLSIWGSPITPTFFNWAFNRDRGTPIRQHWDLIPEKVDILLTHGPPYGIRDLNFQGVLTGCEELNRKIWEVRPSLHVFGHIHEAYGVTEVEGTQFVNASILDLAYKPVHEPVVVDLFPVRG